MSSREKIRAELKEFALYNIKNKRDNVTRLYDDNWYKSVSESNRAVVGNLKYAFIVEPVEVDGEVVNVFLHKIIGE